MKLEKLTPDQEKLMLEVRDEWINLALKENAKGINKPLFEEGIEWLYKDLLGKSKPKVVYCDSWLSCLITINVFKNLSHKQIEKLGASVRDSVGDSVWDSVKGDLQKEFNNYSSYNGFSNYGWVSFYDFFERINVLDNFKFKQYKKLIKSNCFNAYEYENYVFAIQPPIVITKNESGVLNSIEDAAVQFKDGTKYYYIQGRNVSEELFTKLKEDKYTMEDFTKEEDEEIKSACVSFMQQSKGEDYIVSFFRDSLKEVNTFVDKKDERYLEGTTKGMNVGVYTLFKGQINNTDIAYVRCYCPSTDRMFFLGVNSEHNNAKDAISSLYRVPRKLKQQLKRDLSDWENIKVKRSYAGKISAEVKKAKSTNSTSVESVEHNSTNSTVNDNVNVTVNVTDTVIKDRCSSVAEATASIPDVFTTQQKDSFLKFQNWIKDNATRVGKMKEPFTIQQYFSLIEKGYDSNKIRELLADMHNWTDLLKKRQSAYLTLINWQRRENGSK